MVLETPSEQDPIKAMLDNNDNDYPASDDLPPALDDHISEPSSPKEAEMDLETPYEQDLIKTVLDNIDDSLAPDILPPVLDEHASEPSSPKIMEMNLSIPSEQDIVKVTLENTDYSLAHDDLQPAFESTVGEPSSPKEIEPTLETTSELHPINVMLSSTTEEAEVKDDFINDHASPKETKAISETCSKIFSTDVKLDGTNEEVQPLYDATLALDHGISESSSKEAETILKTPLEQDPPKAVMYGTGDNSQPDLDHSIVEALVQDSELVMKPSPDESSMYDNSEFDVDSLAGGDTISSELKNLNGEFSIMDTTHPISEDYTEEPLSPEKSEGFEDQSSGALVQEVQPASERSIDITLSQGDMEPDLSSSGEDILENEPIAGDTFGESSVSETMQLATDQSKDEPLFQKHDKVSLECTSDEAAAQETVNPRFDDLNELPLSHESMESAPAGIADKTKIQENEPKVELADASKSHDHNISSLEDHLDEVDPGEYEVDRLEQESSVRENTHFTSDNVESVSRSHTEPGKDDVPENSPSQEYIQTNVESIAGQPSIHKQGEYVFDNASETITQDLDEAVLNNSIDESPIQGRLDSEREGSDNELDEASKTPDNLSEAHLSHFPDNLPTAESETQPDSLHNVETEDHVPLKPDAYPDKETEPFSEASGDGDQSKVTSDASKLGLAPLDNPSIPACKIMTDEQDNTSHESQSNDLSEEHAQEVDLLGATSGHNEEDEVSRVPDAHDENEESTVYKGDLHVVAELKDEIPVQVDANQEGILKETSNTDQVPMAPEAEIYSNESLDLSNTAHPITSESFTVRSGPAPDAFVSTQGEQCDDALKSPTQGEPADDNSETIPSAIQNESVEESVTPQRDTIGLGMLADDNDSFVPTHDELIEDDQKTPLQLDNLQIQGNLQHDRIEEDHESQIAVQDIESSHGQEVRALDKIAEDENSFIPTHVELDNEDRTHAFSPNAPNSETRELNSQEHVVDQDIEDRPPKGNEADSDMVRSGERSFFATNFQESTKLGAESISTKNPESFLDENHEPLSNLKDDHSDINSESKQTNSLDENASAQHSVPELLDDDESTAPVHQLSDNVSEMEDFTDDGLSMGRVTKVDLNLLSEEICTPDKASTPNMSYENELVRPESDANVACPAGSTRDSPIAEELSPQSVKSQIPSSPTEKESIDNLESDLAASREHDAVQGVMVDSQSVELPSSPKDKQILEEHPHHEDADALDLGANEGSTPYRESSFEPDSKARVVEEEYTPNFSLKTSSSGSTNESNYDEGFDNQPPSLLARLSSSKRSEKTALSPLSKEITLDNKSNISPIDSPHQEFSQLPLDANSPQAEVSPSPDDSYVPEKNHEPELVSAEEINSRGFRVAQLDDQYHFSEETPFELPEDKQSRELPFKVSSDSASLNTIRSLPLDSPMAEESNVSGNVPAPSGDQDSKKPDFDSLISKLDEDTRSISDSIDTIPLADMNNEAPASHSPTNLELEQQRTVGDLPHVKAHLDAPRDMLAAAAPEEEEKYGLKPMRWFSHKEKVWKELWVLTQNENGPCPLIALCNVLILRGGLSVAPKDKPEILFTELIQLLASTLLSRTYQFGDNPTMLERILSFLPTLRTGLDVNIGFQSVRSFGESPEGVPDEMSLFGAFGVELVHGWVPDPEEDKEVYRVLVLGSCGSTYNEVMDFLVQVDSKSEALNSMPPESVEHDALVISSFLERTATQMTYHGLTCLSTTLPNDYLCVLFRNNHFLTLYKRTDGELYLLVTDSGYGQSDFIVWESLQDLDQIDSQFFTSAFTLSSAAASQSEPYTYHQSSASHSTMQSDHNLALSLQRQEERFDALHAPPPVVARDTFGSRHTLSYKSHSLSSPAYHGSTLAAHRRAISYQPGQEPKTSNEPEMPSTPGYEHDPSGEQPTSPKKDKQCIIS